MKYFFLLAIFLCVRAEICLRLLRNKKEIKFIRRTPGQIWLWNTITGEFEQLEALTLNDTAFCSVDVRNDLYGKTMTITTEHMNPYVIKKENNTGVTGFIGDIWTILENTLKFKTIYRRPGRTAVETLMNGDTHALLVATAVYSYTSSYYTYSTPFTKNSYALFVQPEDREFSEWWYTKIFDRGLRIMYFTFIVGIACIILGVYRIKKCICSSYKECDDEFCSPSFNLLYVLGGISGQGIQKMPRSWCLRLIIISYLVMGMLLSCGFSSTLTSYLTVRGNSLPLANLEDVVQKRTHSLCVRNDSSAYRYFTINRSAEGLKAEWEGLVNNGCPDMRNSIMLPSALCHPGFVYLEAPDVFVPIYRKVEHTCRIVQAPGTYFSLQLTFLHSRTSQYRRLINIYLMRLRSAGIFSYLEKKWISEDINDQYHDPQWKILQPVEYAHIYVISVGFSVIAMTSIFICVLENIWYKLQLKVKKMNPNSILLGTCNNSLSIMKMYHKVGSNVVRRRKINSILLYKNMKKQDFLRNVTIRMKRW